MLTTPNLLFVAVMLMSIIAAVFDVRERRIPNLLTAPFFAVGLIVQIVLTFSGDQGQLTSGLLAALFSFVLLGGMWLAGGVGAGDAKLMMAIGIWVGLSKTLLILFGSLVATLVILVAVKGLRRFGVPMGILLQPAHMPGRSANTRVVRGVKLKRGIPFAVGVCATTWLMAILSVLSIGTSYTLLTAAG